MLFVRYKHVREPHTVAVYGKFGIGGNGKIDKPHVALIRFERFQRLMRKVGNQLYLHRREFLVIRHDFIRKKIFENRIRGADSYRARSRCIQLGDHILRLIEKVKRLFNL